VNKIFSNGDLVSRVLAVIAFVLGVIGVLLNLYGCAECAVSAARCHDTVLEICDGAGRWEEMQDCAEMAGWANGGDCCELDGGAECWPAEQCVQK
jgi:hypothetical protein